MTKKTTSPVKPKTSVSNSTKQKATKQVSGPSSEGVKKEDSLLARKVIEQKAEIEKLSKDVEAKDYQAKRYYADLQNALKQHDLDVEQAKKSAKKSVLILVSEFVNTLNLAFSYKPKSDDPELTKFVQTLEGSLQKMINDFSTSGVEIIIPKTGDPVDPNFMNVLNPGTDQGTEIKVKQVVSVALKVSGQLIQPASVMV